MPRDQERDYEVGYGKPPRPTRFKRGQSGNPRGRSSGAKNLKTLLSDALNERVTVSKNGGGHRKITKREAIITQLVNRSATADWRAIKILLDLIRDQKEPVDGPIEYQDVTSARQIIIDRLERLSQCNRRLDRFWLPVGDWQKSRDWYRRHLGFEVEFEIPDRKTVAMRAGAYLTMFLFESEVLPCPGISFAIPVDDVDAKYEELIAEGIPFIHPPMKVFWGYGAELCDPDGYRFRLWDEKSMKEKGSA
jgi:predicted enzyme related to lactoylglutathione lyase